MFCRQSVSDCGYGEYCMMWLFSQENVIQFVFRRRRLYATRTVLLMITKIKWFFFDLLTCLYYTSKWNSSERPDGAAGVDKAFCSDSQCSGLEPCSANRGWVYEKSNSSDMQSQHLLVIAFPGKMWPRQNLSRWSTSYFLGSVVLPWGEQRWGRLWVDLYASQGRP